VSPRDVQTLMTFAGNLADLAEHLEIELLPSQRAKLQAALDLELRSMQTYDDAWPAIELLAARGIKIAVCSNLAWDYCEKARLLLPGLDAYALSSECGLMKPDPMIYRHVCSALGVQPGNPADTDPGRVLMVGDSRKCDEQGPRACGILGYHLDRGGAGPLKSLLDFSAAVVESLDVEQE
ncbi:HAD family hydrolase, partial [Pseudomonas sp. CM27]|uniref:HAD family hydrolase n=2 Tax=unclassified Pseudomonas TaxID=196821 RepID=UPI001C49830C